MTFEEAALLTRSEKVTLVTILAEKRVKIFDVYDAPLDIYVKDAEYFVEAVKSSGAQLTKAASLGAIGAEEFYFSPSEKKLYFKTLSNPSLSDISFVYKFHFSNTPLNLPHDLADGEVIEWLPFIESIGSIGQSLDDLNSGIVMESQSSVSLINNSGFFDEIFDTLLFENKEVSFYSWFPITPLSEVRKIFQGVIDSKDFSPQTITFKVKDFIFRMRDKVSLGVFSEADGDILDSFNGKAKRRIYGRVDKCQAVGIDCVKDGYSLTGTISITLGATAMTGTGTSFLSELSPNDEITFTIDNEPVKFTINSIASNTSAEVSKASEKSIASLTATIRPEIPYRFKNRRWHLAGHKLRSSQAAIVTIINSRQFVVDDPSEFFAEDVVVLNGVTTQVTRISRQQIVLEQSIFPIPVAGDTIDKIPVLRAYFSNNRLILNRDFSLVNTSEAIIELDELAEFNIAKERLTTISFTFTNASRTVSTSANVDLRTLIRPRDWIRKLTQGSDVWFEVLSVETQSILLRSEFTQTTGTEVARIKNVEIINDDSLITADCYGMDYEDKWMRTAADAVKHLVINDAGFTSINEDKFDQADSDCKYTMAMVIPESVGQDAPSIRDVITQINESVMGSLYGNPTQEICYSIVNTRRPIDLSPVKDDDLLSWSSESINDITNKVIVNYAPFVDTISGLQAFQNYEYSSSFVDKYIGIKNTKEITCYLYDLDKATIMAQRTAFYKSLSTLKITLKSKAQFFNYSVNDRIFIQLDRLYKRFGSNSKMKIGIVSSIKKSAHDSEIVLSDMGNIFNRCPTIAPSGTSDFAGASEDEKLKYGFVLGETFTPDITSEEELGNCLIG